MDKAGVSVLRNPSHTPAQPSPQPPASPPPHTLEEVEKTAWGKGEGGLNLFCRTLAETICADDMEAMLWSALSLETWSWGDSGHVRSSSAVDSVVYPL